MRMYDIIEKKRNGNVLTRDELHYFVRGVTDGSIPDYQTSALLMAIYFRGLDTGETAILTDEMAHSGEMVDLSPIPGIKVDKHSTGGVGDKTTLIVAPIVASCGVRVAKMSGRGLGHTGGTIDKLESIPGFNTALTKKQFFDVVRQTGLAVIGQTGNLAPADKKLYALRDVTATVGNVGLIASSIMSKKIAAGSDAIVLDVTTGSGAFMKSPKDAVRLAREMVDIGTRVGRKTVALITDMDVPLGYAIGNSLEIIEAVETLHGGGAEDLRRVCIELAASMLYLGNNIKLKLSECREDAREALDSGKAFEAFCRMVRAQGGDVSYIRDTSKFEQAGISHDILCPCDGYIEHMDTEKIGIVSVMLGAGREVKDAPIDHSAGILLKKKTGERVHTGDVLATFKTNRANAVENAEREYLAALRFGERKPRSKPLIRAWVSAEGVEMQTEK